jgi:hypothetical protein
MVNLQDPGTHPKGPGSFSALPPQFGALDRATIELLDGLAQGEKPGTVVNRRLNAGTVLVRAKRF